VLTLTDSANYKWTDSTEAEKTLSFEITKAAAPTVTVPTPSAVTYDPTKTLADITLTDGWAWVTGTTVTTVTNSGYEAALTVDDANYDYTNVQGYNSETHEVTRTVSLTVNKATVTAPTIVSKTYTGQKQTATVASSTLYSVTTNNGGTNVGSYDVVLTLTDPANYKWTDSTEAAKTLKFNITKATAPTVTVPTPSAVTYDPAKKLSDITLSDGWAWVTGTTVPTVVNEGYAAVLKVDDANYDYTGVDGYDAQEHRVTRTVSLTVNPARISSVAVTDITAPEANVALDTEATTNTEHVTLKDEGMITWDPAAPQDGKAAYAKIYKAAVTAIADANYAFADDVTATVNTETTTVTKNDDGTLDIACTFEKTALTPVTIEHVN
jgi:hypothetical protein